MEKALISSINEDSITIGPAATTTGSIELFTVKPQPAQSPMGIVIWIVLIGWAVARLVPFFSKK